MNNSTHSVTAIKKLLVANRGEIAIRICRAATELGIRTVAIYSHQDRYSLHRYKADEAYCIGEKSEPLKPYLDGEAIIAIAQKVGADAIHPGYGFLSERVEFVRLCDAAGITFVGPRAEVMDALGDKIDAKQVARDAGVPVIEGGLLESGDDEAAAVALAESVGFPLLVKAAAGGGGRGMRVVRSKEELLPSMKEASREALQAFGDGTVFLERFVENPKHIEVQLLGDTHGNLIHLFERDCSVQRRFQKVVELAPAPALTDETRSKLFEYALSIGKQVGYSNAGTVEFLVDQQEQIFFIEVNPRIQVEHTVTEEVTGVDIVRAQLLVASGHRLSDEVLGLAQDKVHCRGVALQCRITTEDPENNFQPDYGKIVAYRSPGGFGIRLDAGSAHTGAIISPYFDSMLVKLTCRSHELESACARLIRCLSEFRVRGLKTNIPFLINVLRNEEFRRGAARVQFIESHPELFEFRKPRDRATKMLRYLGEVIVNGNPDIKPGTSRPSVPQITVPKVDARTATAAGSKDKLRELGREKFVEWLRNEQKVHFTDTTFRDAHQSLLATRVRTHDMVAVARAFAVRHPEVFSMEVWGGATFDVALRFLHECPWDRLAQLRAAVPNILLQMLLRGSNAVGYKAYPDNVVEAFIEEAADTGIDVFRIFDSMNWLEAMKVSIQTVREKTDALAEVCICYTGDILDPNRSKFNLDYYVELAKRIEGEGAHILCIKDMAGLLKPHAARILIEALRDAVALPIHLHTHDTSSVQSASLLQAVDAGVDVIDVALASMSGLTSQPNGNSIVRSLQHHPRGTDCNSDSLDEFSRYWESVRKIYAPFESGLRAGTAEVYEHEIPGGQYSNLQPQARALGLEGQFEQIARRYKEVNHLLGDIVKVTPSSKVVGDLALYLTSNNLEVADVLARGDELSFPDSLKQFLRGELGQPHGGFPMELVSIVLRDEKPMTGRPNEHLTAADLEAELKTLKEQWGDWITYRDALSSVLYPKVFADYAATKQKYGTVAALPSMPFFYGLETHEECLVDIDQGKTLIISYRYSEEPNEEGLREVHFHLNGQERSVMVQDTSIEVTKKQHEKAEGAQDVGSPLQGRLAQVHVAVGDQVEKGQPLFTIEAMKMETVVTSPKTGAVEKVPLEAGTLVQSEDLVVRFAG